MKTTGYNKTLLVRELAVSVDITQKKARTLLETLRQIAYREARDQGFTLPGICRLDVIRRKSRKMRNPQTGENLLIAEHDSLRVRVLKIARNAVTPPPENLITVQAPEIQPEIMEDFSKAVSFCCKKCGQEIEAPLSAVNLLAECLPAGPPSLYRPFQNPERCTGPRCPSRQHPRLRPRPRRFKAAPRLQPQPRRRRPRRPHPRSLRQARANLRARRSASTWPPWASTRPAHPLSKRPCRRNVCSPSSARTAARRSRLRLTWLAQLRSAPPAASASKSRSSPIPAPCTAATSNTRRSTPTR